MKELKRSFDLLAMLAMTLVLVGCSLPPTVNEASVYADYEGLRQVNARRFDAAFVKSNVPFESYTGVILEAPVLAFRTPDRSKQQFPLTGDQKNEFHDLLAEKLMNEFSRDGKLPLVEHSGPETLRLHIRVIDITATVQPGGKSFWGLTLDAVGQATLVLELFDSESNELLARAFDQRAVEGAAILKGSDALTAWEDLERLCALWARKARVGLDNLVSL